MGIVLVGVLATGGWIAFEQHNHQKAVTRESATGPDLPKPSGKLSQFNNSSYGYTLQYPVEWGLNVADNQSYMNVYVLVAKGDPGLPGFEITCDANPSHLTAQQWWQAHMQTVDHDTSIGPITFTSGVQAYKGTGQGENPFDVYTVVHGNTACQIVNEQHGTAQVTQQADAAINSFRWN
jgi:hypothetical protein